MERPWLYGVIGRTVQERIREHCYPKLTIFTLSGNPSGRFGIGYGFYNLLGAVWLQMAWLLDSDNATYCKLPDCGRVITIEPGQPAPDSEVKDADGRWKSNVRGTYKTRRDIEFCKDRPCRQNYSYRKTAGWPGYGQSKRISLPTTHHSLEVHLSPVIAQEQGAQSLRGRFVALLALHPFYPGHHIRVSL